MMVQLFQLMEHGAAGLIGLCVWHVAGKAPRPEPAPVPHQNMEENRVMDLVQVSNNSINPCPSPQCMDTTIQPISCTLGNLLNK